MQAAPIRQDQLLRRISDRKFIREQPQTTPQQPKHKRRFALPAAARNYQRRAFVHHRAGVDGIDTLLV